MPAPPELAENTGAPDELEDSATEIPPAGAMTGLPSESCACTVIGPSEAAAEAAPDTAVEVIFSFPGAAA